MSNYIKSTDFAGKDALNSGDAAKVVKGTEIGAEFDAIQTAVNSKANASSAALTGVPTAPTAAVATNTTQIATTAFVIANTPATATYATSAGTATYATSAGTATTANYATSAGTATTATSAGTATTATSAGTATYATTAGSATTATTAGTATTATTADYATSAGTATNATTANYATSAGTATTATTATTANYATSAGTATYATTAGSGSVTWSNVTSKPTMLSILGSASISGSINSSSNAANDVITINATTLSTGIPEISFDYWVMWGSGSQAGEFYITATGHKRKTTAIQGGTNYDEITIFHPANVGAHILTAYLWGH